jgi:hypothetical protein
MAYCPHCRDYYDEDNDTQPCCGCGHPIVCCSSPDFSEPGDDTDVSADVEDLISKAESTYHAAEMRKLMNREK